MKKFILLCGVSGSGKNSVTENLINQREYPQFNFVNLNQVTTRAMRENEVDGREYIFLNREKYESLKDKLIAKTNFYGNFYGTFDQSLSYLENGKYNLNIIIVNREGRDASIKDIKEKYGDDALTLTVQIVNNNLQVKREGRNDEDILKEKKDLDEVTDVKVENNTGYWLKNEDFIKTLMKYNFI